MQNFKELYDRAHAAGMEAVDKAVVQPMYVYSTKSVFSDELDETQPVYKIADGLCGFACVNLKPANSAFAKWLRKMDLADKRYGAPGVSMWIYDFNQSYEKKRVYAAAFADVLREEGLNAWSESRLD